VLQCWTGWQTCLVTARGVQICCGPHLFCVSLTALQDCSFLHTRSVRSCHEPGPCPGGAAITSPAPQPSHSTTATRTALAFLAPACANACFPPRHDDAVAEGSKPRRIAMASPDILGLLLASWVQ
jgi:hypothetical protein